MENPIKMETPSWIGRLIRRGQTGPKLNYPQRKNGVKTQGFF